VLAPGGFERYFDELATVIARDSALPAPDMLAAMGAAHGSHPAGEGPA
jgi:hypothetical protein